MQEKSKLLITNLHCTSTSDRNQPALDKSTRFTQRHDTTSLRQLVRSDSICLSAITAMPLRLTTISPNQPPSLSPPLPCFRRLSSPLELRGCIFQSLTYSFVWRSAFPCGHYSRPTGAQRKTIFPLSSGASDLPKDKGGRTRSV